MSGKRVLFQYFPSHGLWEEKTMHRHMADLRAIGAEGIAANFIETDDRSFLKRTVRIAHQEGVRAYAIPGRVAGLFSAGPRPCSAFAVQRPDTLMRDRNGQPIISSKSHICCPNHPDFQAWFYPFICRVVAETDADGVELDEPKASKAVCYCEHCKALTGDHSDESMQDLHYRTMAGMIGRLAADVKRQVAGSKEVIASISPIQPRQFYQYVCEQPAVDIVGVDGPVCAQHLGGENAEYFKERLYDSIPRLSPLIGGSGKKVTGLTETFDVSVRSHDELVRGLDRVPDLDLDLYMFNYYGHNNGDPEFVMDRIRSVVRRLTGTSA